MQIAGEQTAAGQAPLRKPPPAAGAVADATVLSWPFQVPPIDIKIALAVDSLLGHDAGHAHVRGGRWWRFTGRGVHAR